MDWSKFVAVNGATAHPHTEPDGTTYNMGNSYTSKGTSVVAEGTVGPPRVSDNLLLRTGAYYNIIRVPPTKKTEEETLEGTAVLCTIPSSDKTKPSYYHSFGGRASDRSVQR